VDDTGRQGPDPDSDPFDEEPFGFLPSEPDPVIDSSVDPRGTPSLDLDSDPRLAAADPHEAQPLPAQPPRGHIPHRYRRSGGASMLAAGMIGLRDILESPKDDRPVVEQHTNDDDIQRPIEVFLDPDDPSASLVVIRDPADDN
jgi:hypothetical protein